MTTETEVLDAEKQPDPHAIAEYKPIEAAFAELDKEFKGVQWDVSTTKGLDAAKAGRMRLVRLRTSLEAKRKEIKAPVLDRAKLIDSEAKRITERLEALETPLKDQIDKREAELEAERLAREQAERARVSAIKDRITGIADLPVHAVMLDAATIATMSVELMDTVIDEATFAEYVTEASDARDRAALRLETLYRAAQDREAEEAKRKAELEAAQAAAAQAKAEADAAAAKMDAMNRARAGIESLQAWPMLAISKASGEIGKMIDDLINTDLAVMPFGHLLDEAERARDASVAALTIMRDDAKKAEEQAAQAAADEEKRNRSLNLQMAAGRILDIPLMYIGKPSADIRNCIRGLEYHSEESDREHYAEYCFEATKNRNVTLDRLRQLALAAEMEEARQRDIAANSARVEPTGDALDAEFDAVLNADWKFPAGVLLNEAALDRQAGDFAQAQKIERPTEAAIVQALCREWVVSEDVVIHWLLDLDHDTLRRQLVEFTGDALRDLQAAA